MLSLIPKFSLWPTTRPIKTQKGFTTIAVGAGGLIARSTDGVTWTEPVSGVTTDLHMAAYGGGVWMIVGASSTILKSTDDGVTWVKLTLSSDITTNVPMGVASIVYDAGRFLVITNNRMCIFTSDNGATWTRINASSMHVSYFKSRARRWSTDGKVYQNGGGSGNGYTVFSWNGSNYTATNETVDAGSAYIVQSAIAFSDAVAVSLQQGGKINRKPSGSSWSRAFAGANNNNMYDGGVAYNSLDNTFYAIGNVGSAPALLTGVDGSNWQQAANAATMFGATQTLSDISAYDKNSFIVGGTKIFTSTDWSSWSLAYTASKTFNAVFTRERVINNIVDAYRWRLVSLKDLEYIEDVTEKFLDYTGGLNKPVDKGYHTTSNGQSITHTDATIFTAEDFTISLVLTPSITLQANMGKDIHIASGDIATNGGLGSTWYITWATNFQNFIIRYYKADGTSEGFFPSGTITIPANTDFHIELGRKDDVLYLFYNGVKQTLTSKPTGAGKAQTAGYKGIALGSPGQTSFGFNGWRRNFVIDRGICRHTENFTVDMQPIVQVRQEYTEEDAKAIRYQFDMRRDSNQDAATGRLVNCVGYNTNFIRRGRMYFSGTQSPDTNSYQAQLDPWGAGDFTLEASLVLNSVGSTGAILLAEWYYGTATDDRNRWSFSIGSDRRPVFGIAASAVGNSAVYVTSNYAITFGLAYKVIIERISGVLSIHILDAYSGVLYDTTSGALALPIRGAMPHVMTNSSAAGMFWAGAGSMWDVRIADKAMYNGKPAISAAFPAVPDRRYSEADQANVVAQFSGSNPAEQILSAYVGVTDGSLVINNQINIPGGGFQLSKTTVPFMDADFTIEARVGINSISASPTSLCGQFLSGRTDNTWQLRNVAGNLVAVLSKTGGVADADLITLNSGVAWVAGQEYYLVVERVGSTITLYVDGVAKATATYSGTFPTSPTAIQRGDYSTFNGWLRDLRCSKVAQYKGNVPKFPQYPRVRKSKPYITLGFCQGGVGTIYGYLENSDYSSKMGFISLGSCSQKLWQVGGVVRRIKGLFIDRGNYMIIGWEVTNIVPSADIPTWTETLEINGTRFENLSKQPYSGFTTPLTSAGTGVSVYWSGAASFWGTLQPGRMVSFDFV